MPRISQVFKQFAKNESGAVTVDWVLLTALVVGMSALGVASIGDAAGSIGESIVESITDEDAAPDVE